MSSLPLIKSSTYPTFAAHRKNSRHARTVSRPASTKQKEGERKSFWDFLLHPVKAITTRIATFTPCLNVTLSEEAQHALDLIENGESAFITGHAGTGKSTLLRHFRDSTKKNVVVVAPTGLAAVQIGGQMI